MTQALFDEPDFDAALEHLFGASLCCRHCGCSDHDACPDDGSGQPCQWIVPPTYEAGGVCSHPVCVALLQAELLFTGAGQEVHL